MSEYLLEVKNLKKYFDNKSGILHAVDDVSLSIKKGETIGVVGESGCGKSTLGRTILRLLPATDGQVVFEGIDVLDLNRRKMKSMRKDMQIVFQDPYSSLNPSMTIYDLIEEPLKLHKVLPNNQIRDKVFELMKTVGVGANLVNAYPHELDGGKRQRVCIARALALEPKFIVCDEPVSALDVSIQAQILNLLMDLQETRDISYMFITHDLSVVKHISDKIMVMYLGEMVELADADELFNNPKHPYTQKLLKAIPVMDIEKKDEPFELIQGEISSPINPGKGCRFYDRCPKAQSKCKDGVETHNEGAHVFRCNYPD